MKSIVRPGKRDDRATIVDRLVHDRWPGCRRRAGAGAWSCARSRSSSRSRRSCTRFREVHFSDPFGPLRRDEVDLLTTWLPVDEPELTPSGRPIPRGPAAGTFQEVLALVAAGDVVCPVPDEGRRYYPRPGVAYVRLDDAPPVRWALVWRSSRATPLVRALVGVTRG